MAKLMLVGAALLLCLSTAAAGDGCRDTITGFSGTFGKRMAGHSDRFTNQTGSWRSVGAMTKLEGFYSSNYGCVQGLKITYGPDPSDARLIGHEAEGLATQELSLNQGELVSKVQIKADNCVEYLRLHTSEGRVFELGNAASPTTLITSYPNRPTGFLAAVRGFEEYSKNGGSPQRGALRTLQFVWANCNAPANRGPTFNSAGGAAEKPAPSSRLELESAPLDAAAAAEATAMLEAAKAPPADLPDPAAAAIDALACPAMADMCAGEASSTSTAFCPVVAPFKKAACMGGCCVSSGKCTSSSCAISGVGKEVPNTICYGLNPAIAIGASASCRGLACKLSVPGCTSDLLGGSCVGTVVDLGGGAVTRNPAGAKLLGYSCLDVTPSDKTLNKDGQLVKGGDYVAKLWSICDCHAPTVAPKAGGFMGFPAVGKLNMTDLKGLIATFRPDNGSSPLHGLLEVVKSKLPPMVVPEGESGVNVTSALSVIGALIGKAANPDGETTQMGAIYDLIKGAAAVSAAGNSTNPLGSLLGAMAPKEGADGAQTNPLAGLGNLVAALAPKDAGVAEKSDTLSTLLTALGGGTGAAPQAELLGAVAKMVSGSDGGGGVDLGSILSKFSGAPKAAGGEAGAGGGPDVVKSLLNAASVGREAATGPVNLGGILARAREYMGGGGVSAAAAPGATGPLGFLKNFAPAASGAADGASSLQGIMDMAQKAAPLVQMVNGGGRTAVASLPEDAVEGDEGAADAVGPAGVGPAGQAGWAGMVKNMAGGDKGPLSGVDVNAVGALAQKVGPLLQAIGSGQGGVPTGQQIMAAAQGVGAGINVDGSSFKGLTEQAAKLAPVLQSLTKATGTSGEPNLVGLQGFLDRLRQPLDKATLESLAAGGTPVPGLAEAAAAAADAAAPAAAGVVKAAALPEAAASEPVKVAFPAPVAPKLDAAAAPVAPKAETAPAKKVEAAPAKKEEAKADAPVLKLESAKVEAAPAKKVEAAPAKKEEAAPAKKEEAAPAKKEEAAPANKEEAPAKKVEAAAVKAEAPPAKAEAAAPAKKVEAAPAKKEEAAPVLKLESAKVEAAPAKKVEAAPAKAEAAPAKKEEAKPHA